MTIGTDGTAGSTPLDLHGRRALVPVSPSRGDAGDHGAEGAPAVSDATLAWLAAVIGQSLSGTPDPRAGGTPPDDDLGRLSALIVRHRVLPLAEQALRTSGSAASSARWGRLRDWLATQRTARIRRTLLICGRLGAVVRALDARGLPCLSLKGVALGARCFPSLGIRETGDIDLLVERRAVAEVHNALEGQGFRLVDEATRVPVEGPPTLTPFEHHVTYLGQDGLVLELHHRLHPNRFLMPVPIRTLMDTAACVELAGVPVPVLAEPFHTMYLATHGARHSWRRLQWLLDIWMLQRAAGAAWESVIERAEAMRLGVPLHSGIILANGLFGGTLPEPSRLAYRRSAGLRYAVRHGMDALCCTRAADETPIAAIPTSSILPALMAQGGLRHGGVEMLQRLQLIGRAMAARVAQRRRTT